MTAVVGRRHLLVLLLGGIASAAFLYLAVRGLTWGDLSHALSGAVLWPWLPLGVVSYLAGHVVRGHRCRLLFGPEAPLSLGTASNIVVVGYAANNVLPARLGEFVRAGMLSERTGVPYSQALTVTFVERLLDGIAILLWLMFAAAVLPDVAGWVSGLIEFASLVFGVAFAALAVAVLAPAFVLSVASRLTAPMPGVGERLVRLATRVTNAAAYLRQPSHALTVMTLSMVVWGFECGLFAAVCRAFGLSLDVGQSALTMSVTNLGILVPSTPGFVGTFHGFCAQALGSLGVEHAVAVSSAIVIHLAFYIPVTLWGLLALLFYGIQVGATVAAARDAQHIEESAVISGVPVHVISSVQEPARQRVPGRFEFALTDALLRLGDGQEPDPARARAATEFLSAQLQALPARYRALLRLGLATFRVLVAVRYLRPFASLKPSTRVRIATFWAFGPVLLFRRMFRALRSPLLLSYYDVSELRARPELAGAVNDEPATTSAPRRRLPLAEVEER